jgi:hypothetical protein
MSSSLVENNIKQGVDNLGPLLREHRLRRELAILYPALSILGLSGTAIAAVWTAWRWIFAFNTYGVAAILRWTAPALLIVLCFAGIGILGLILTWRSRGFRVILHSEGMVYRKGRYQESILWNQMMHIYTSAVRYGFSRLAWGAQTTLRINMSDDRQIHLPHALTDINGLAEFIKSQVYPGLLEEYRRKYNDGEPLLFGPLILNAEGVQYKDETIKWENVERVSLGRGNLYLELPDSKSLRTVAHRVPNVEICAQLIDHLRTKQGANHPYTSKDQV